MLKSQDVMLNNTDPEAKRSKVLYRPVDLQALNMAL